MAFEPKSEELYLNLLMEFGKDAVDRLWENTVPLTKEVRFIGITKAVFDNPPKMIKMVCMNDQFIYLSLKQGFNSKTIIVTVPGVTGRQFGMTVDECMSKTLYLKSDMHHITGWRWE